MVRSKRKITPYYSENQKKRDWGRITIFFYKRKIIRILFH